MGKVYQITFLINVDFLTKVSKGHTLGLGPRPCLLLDGRAWLGSSIAMWSQQTRRLLSGRLIPITLRYRAGSGSMLLSRSCAFCFFAFASSYLPRSLWCLLAGRPACHDGCVPMTKQPTLCSLWIAATVLLWRAEWLVIEKELIVGLQNEIQKVHCKLVCTKSNLQ